jgi:hypothetical protein
MGFTQRQAGGKFTSAEADAFIEGLQNTEVVGPSPVVDPRVRLTPAQRPLRQVPVQQLVDELQRRGFTVTAPPTPAP